MKKIFFFLGLMFPIVIQAQTINFVKTMGPAHFFSSLGNGRSVVIDDQKNILISGSFYGTNDFDPGPGVFNLTGTGPDASPWDAYFAKYDSSGNFIWARSTGSLPPEYVNNTIVDHQGFSYSVIRFYQTVDFDMGSGTFNLTSNGGMDIAILKLDASGNFVYAQRVGGASDEQAYTLSFDSDSNIVMAGYYSGTVDFDPGVGTINLNSATDGVGFIASYTRSGTINWARAFGGSTGSAYQIHAANDGIIMNGSFKGINIDLDPGTGVHPMSSKKPTSYDQFILKTDVSGNLIWITTFTASNSVAVNEIQIDHDQNIYASGYFIDTLYIDLSNLSDFSYKSDFDFFVAKWDSTGHIQWHKTFGNNDPNQGLNIKLDRYDYPLVSGNFLNTMDFDPSPAVYTLYAGSSAYMGFVEKFSPEGAFIFVRNCASMVTDLDVDTQNDIYLHGDYWTSTIDMDPGPSSLPPVTPPIGIFFSKWYQDSCSYIPLHITLDSVSNITCALGTSLSQVSVSGGLAPYLIQWDTGAFATDTFNYATHNGVHVIVMKDSMGCSANINYLINGPDYPLAYDLDVNYYGYHSFIPGHTTPLAALCVNNGCIPVIGGTISLVLDSAVDFWSSVPAPYMILGDTIIWQMDTMGNDSVFIVPDITLYTHETAHVGDSLHFTLYASPMDDDAIPVNNSKYFSFKIHASFDPNMKEVYPQGVNINHGILNNQRMTYTVHFQNTGTASADNIYIIDTLDTHLDLPSIRIVYSSHYMFTELLPGNVLKFHFPHINLPDSTSDEPNSRGYVIYEVDQLPNLPHNTVIENTAAIYFDYNAPVITNTVFNTIDLGAQIITSINNSCPGDSAMLTVVPNVPGLQTNWQWFEGTCSGTYLGHGNNIVVTPSLTTSYFVKDSMSVMCFSTTINTLPVYDVTQNSTICSNDSLFFGAGYVHDPGSYAYTFPSESGCDSTVTLTLSHYLNDSLDYAAAICTGDSIYFGSQYYNAPGLYLHTFTNSYGCDSIVTLILGNTLVNTALSETDPTLTATASPAAYQWVDCNAGFAPLSGQTNQSYTATGNGNYAVIVTENGCTDTSACYSIISTGISETLNANILVYPNPINNELNIVFNNNSSPAEITLTDMTGQVILRNVALSLSKGQTLKLQTGTLKAGVYCLTIINGNEVVTAKLIKE